MKKKFNVNEFNKRVSPLREQMRTEQSVIQKKYNDIIASMLSKELPYKVGDIIYFYCTGSGYYGEYVRCTDSTIILLKTNKQGVIHPSNTLLEFSIWDFNRLHRHKEVVEVC